MRRGAIKREQWKSKLGFVLASVGSAIGLGNIWRFSYIAYSHGGGAFLIPYIFALITVGIPLLILEYGIGHERIGSAPLAYHKIRPRWEWIGWWAVIFVMFGISLYYTVIIAWCLDFFFLSFNLGWGSDPNSFFFKKFLAVSSSPAHIGQIRSPILWALIAVWFLNWIIIYRGVQGGVELANKIFMPMLFILTAVLVFWSLGLNGASSGIYAYLRPDFKKLLEPSVWIDAFSQVFFSLSIGFGIMITYASYLPAKANITRYSIITALMDSGYAVFAGFAVFAVLGFMAKSQGVPISEVVTEPIGLAFVVYPKALTLMPMGNLFGAIFFFCLFVAGISSSISIIEAFTAAMMDKFGTERKKVVTSVCIIGFLTSIIFTSQAGLHWISILDHFITNYGLVTVGILECILVGWLFNIEMLRRHINRVSTIKIGRWWDGLVRYFIPFVLGVILVGDIYHEILHPYGNYSWAALILIGRDWLIMTFVAAYIISTRPWKTEKPLIKGRAEELLES